MTTRRSLLISGTGAIGGVLAFGTYTGFGLSGTATSDDADHYCRATAQRHPQTNIFTIDSVSSNITETTVEYNLEQPDQVDSVAIVADDDVLAEQSTTLQEDQQIPFSRDGPMTFEIQMRDEGNTVLDYAAIHVECGGEQQTAAEGPPA